LAGAPGTITQVRCGNISVVSRPRTYLLGTAVVLLLAVVAVAATSGGGAARPGNGLRPPGFLVSIGAVVGTAVVVVLLVVVGYQLLADLAEKPPQEMQAKRRWWAWLIVAALFVGLRFAIVGLRRLLGAHPASSASTGGSLHVRPPFRLPASAHPPAGVTGFDLLTGLGLALVVLAVGFVFVRRSARTTGASRASHARLDDLPTPGAEMVEGSLDALLAEPDPRRAVIAAYQSMDRWLAMAGLGRERWEAPFEHLSRVLQGLGATAPLAHQLASLFERAKFDKRPCGPEMKDEALAALVLLRENLVLDRPGGPGSGPHTAGGPVVGTAAPAGARAAP
jgi:hypothetical protein